MCFNIQQGNFVSLIFFKKIPIIINKIKMNNEQVPAEVAMEMYVPSAEFYSRIIDSLQDYSIFTMSKDLKINSWNSGAKKIFQYETNEIIGKPFEIIFTEEDKKEGIPKKEIEAPANAVTGFSWYQNNVFVSVDDIGEPVSVSGQFMYFYVHMSDGEEKVLFFIGSSWEKALLNGIQKEGSLREINEYKNYFSYSWDGEPNKIISLQWAGNGNFKTENF